MPVQVSYVRANNLTFNAAFVSADAATSNSIEYSEIFPLGTGALSYISAAAYQLREANILDIDQPVTIYLDPTDFGYANQWCPDIYGQPAANTPTGRPLSENTTGIVKLALAAGYESNAGQESPLKLAHVASSYRLDA